MMLRRRATPAAAALPRVTLKELGIDGYLALSCGFRRPGRSTSLWATWQEFINAWEAVRAEFDIIALTHNLLKLFRSGERQALAAAS